MNFYCVTWTYGDMMFSGDCVQCRTLKVMGLMICALSWRNSQLNATNTERRKIGASSGRVSERYWTASRVESLQSSESESVRTSFWLFSRNRCIWLVKLQCSKFIKTQPKTLFTLTFRSLRMEYQLFLMKIFIRDWNVKVNNMFGWVLMNFGHYSHARYDI